ncbi:MAG: PP2C family protein-serine/threonine phosphatase [Lachnospiraceae bacterium]|nr:PP2C family protein-serine/threonine phosphatase [Lachnospiraceae bacterium]
MIDKIKKLRSNMAFNITAVIMLLLIAFGTFVCVAGIWKFSSAFDDEYSNTTYHIADTAASLVNGDHIKEYLAGQQEEEYNRTKRILNAYCTRMSVSLVYVIDVDQSDYGRFVSVFNAVDNSVDDSNYKEWERGYQRETTNENYRSAYKDIYEGESPYEIIYRFNPGPGLHQHITMIVPVKNSEGKVAALLCVQRPISELASAIGSFVTYIVIAALILSVIVVQFLARFLRKWVVGPIRTISNEATRFARENTKGKELGDVSKYEEIYNLSRSIDKMETDMVKYVDNLTLVTAERERIGTELSFAKQIQYSSLPTKFPAFPDRGEFDVYAYMRPAKEVGGDFYNFILVDNDHLAMWIGDVSDKGVPAALFMMAINIMISLRTSMGGTPAQIMEHVNDRVCEHNGENLFVTIWLGILEISTGKLTFVNAGHEDPAVCHKDGEFELYKTRHNIAVGIEPGMVYKDYELQLGKGDKIFIYTDGVPEATDPYDKLFSTDRMTQALNECRDGSPQELLENINKRVKEFVGDRTQFDDLTMLGLELK